MAAPTNLRREPSLAVGLGPLLSASADEVGTAIVSAAVRATQAQRGFLLLTNGRDWTIIADAQGPGVRPEPVSAPDPTRPDATSPTVAGFDTTAISTRVLDRVAASRTPLVAHDVPREEELVGDQQLRGHGVKSLFCAPLIESEQVIGVIYLIDDRTSGRFTPRRVEAVTPLLTVAAAAVSGARANQRLRERLEIYDRVMNTTTEGIWMVDPQGRTLGANPGMARMIGYRAEEMVGRPATQFVYPDDFADNDERIASRRRGVAESYERRFRHKDGSVVWALVSATPITDAAGRHLGSVGFVADIARWRMSEEALRQSELRLSEAQRIAHIGNWELDIAANVLVWSDEIYRIFEIDPDRFKASYDAFLAAIHPDDRDYVNQIYSDSVAQHRPYDVIHRLQMPDGRIKFVNERCETFYDDVGRPTRSVGIVHDITESQAAQETLRQSQAYNRGLIEASLDGLVTVNERLIITDVNDSFCRLTGHSRDELLESPFPSHFTDPVQAAQGVRLTLERGSVADYELVLAHVADRGASGVLVSFNAATYAEPATGEVRGIFAAARDITERRRAEQEVLRLNIRRRDDALEASRLKSEFLATMSHEIRTPMNGVIGLTTLLADTSLDATQRRYVAGIDTAGKALLAIISDVLDISKIEAGELVIVPREMDLSEAVERVIILLREAARVKGIELTGQVSPGMPATVVGDPVRVHQILLNLVDNAVKFTEHGGVSVRVLPAPGGDRDAATVDAMIEVTDTGIGISPDDMGRLFEKFGQSTPSPTRPQGGTGLGLAITKQLVELMGGDVGVNSEIGRGSTFWCTLPFGRISSQQRPSDAR